MSDSGNRFIFGLIWPSRPASGRTHTLIERLSELRDIQTSGKSVLSAGEYSEIRSTFLGELATHPRTPFAIRFTFVAFIVFGIVAIVYCFLEHVGGAAWVGAVSIIASGLMWWRTEQSNAAKRNLSRADRLAAVDELTAAQLITPEESTALKTRIAQLQLTTDL